VSAEFPIALVRNARYLNWRYRKPGQEYVRFICCRDGALAGYIVLRVLEAGNLKVGLIMDLLADRASFAGKHLIRRAIQWGLDLKLDFIDCWMVPNSYYYRLLRMMGFRERPSETRLVLRKFNADVPLDFLTNLGNWYLTLGDTDEA